MDAPREVQAEPRMVPAFGSTRRALVRTGSWAHAAELQRMCVAHVLILVCGQVVQLRSYRAGSEPGAESARWASRG